MPNELPTLTLTLELSRNIHATKTRQRCPNARFTLVTASGSRDAGTLRADVEKPRLDLGDASVAHVDAGHVLANVIDEAAWLAELARVLHPGGTLAMKVPANGPLAWLDANNLYRYATDILGRGDTPDATLPTGWNRHYSPRDAFTLLRDAGFTSVCIARAGLGVTEVPQIAGLLVGNFLLGKRDTELKLHPARRRLERLDARIPAPGIGTILSITATRARMEPDDPSRDAAPGNRPAPEIDHE